MIALGGTLERRGENAWHWTDTGEHEPRVRDMTLAWLAPNYRCLRYGSEMTYVEIPREWRAQIQDRDVRAAVSRVLLDYGREADIFAERAAKLLDDHRICRAGYLLPVERWDRALADVCGVVWDKKDEQVILARANQIAGVSNVGDHVHDAARSCIADLPAEDV